MALYPFLFHSKGSILTSLDSIAAESIGERSAWCLNGHCLPDFRREGVVKETAACVECTRDRKPMLSAGFYIIQSNEINKEAVCA